MLEAIATAILVCGSSLLFAYWFRYACGLILTAKPARSYSDDVAKVNHLGFVAVQKSLRCEAAPDLARFRVSLDRDYYFLTYFLAHGARPAASLELLILRLDYRMMAAWCTMISRIAPGVGRRAVDEMATVLAHFADRLGEQAAVGWC
jgi:hypothetical protein